MGNVPLLLFVDLRGDLQQVIGRLDGREIPIQSEQPPDFRRVVGRIVEPPQAASGIGFDVLIDDIEIGFGLRQFLTEAGQGMDERFDVVLADEANAGLDVGQRQATPVLADPRSYAPSNAETLHDAYRPVFCRR